MTAPAQGPIETPIRVLLVDDDPLVRAGLVMLVGREADMSVVGEASDGIEVPELIGLHAPDIVLMDIRMPIVDGLTATEELRARQDAPEVIVLTTFNADEQVIRALRAGAAGFVLKDTHPAEIVTAVRRVAMGEPILSPSVTRQLMAHVATQGSDQRRTQARTLLDRLHDRERATAIAIGHGKSNAEIADRLCIGVATVKTHVSRIMTRLGLNNRVQIAILVHDTGLFDEDERFY